MRDELADVVGRLIANLPPPDPQPLDDAERKRLTEVVGLAVKLRGHVSRDRYSREIEAIYDAEGTGRLLACLKRLFGGAVRIGLSRADALALVETVALDSCPPIRRKALGLLSQTSQTTRAIAVALDLPTITARRALEELSVYRLAIRERAPGKDGKEKKGGADQWRIRPDYAQSGSADSPAAAGAEADPEGEAAPDERAEAAPAGGAESGVFRPAAPEESGVEGCESAISLDIRKGNLRDIRPRFCGFARGERPPRSPEERVTAAEGVGVEFVLDEQRPGFTWIYAPSVNPNDPALKIAEAAIEADRSGVEAVLRQRLDGGKPRW
jgi:hypothetical protein